MDELDHLVATERGVNYKNFDWPTLMDGRVVVIAVTITMDLPERLPIEDSVSIG